MATFTINSKLHGKQEFSVYAGQSGSGYVRLNGRQICEGGKITGSTVRCKDDDYDLEKTARAWWAAKLRNDRKF